MLQVLELFIGVHSEGVENRFQVKPKVSHSCVSFLPIVVLAHIHTKDLEEATV